LIKVMIITDDMVKAVYIGFRALEGLVQGDPDFTVTVDASVRIIMNV